MTRRAVIAGGLLAIAIAIWALFFRGGSEEDAVRAVVKRTADAVKVIPGENPLLRATRIRGELIETLAPDVSVSIPELTDLARGRDPLTSVAVAATGAWEKAEISISFRKVQLDQGVAFVDAVATLDATRAGGPAERDTRRCSFRLEKRDGRFRIFEITVYPKESP